jgi:hypothetical protein
VTDELRTWPKFSDLSGGRYETGRLSWEAHAVAGHAFTVWEELASVDVGDGWGASLSIGADAFGTFTRRLVEEGAQVRPGQAIAEVAHRDPTLAEYRAESDRANQAEQRVRELERRVREVESAPLRAAWQAFRRRRGRQ